MMPSKAFFDFICGDFFETIYFLNMDLIFFNLYASQTKSNPKIESNILYSHHT